MRTNSTPRCKQTCSLQETKSHDDVTQTKLYSTLPGMFVLYHGENPTNQADHLQQARIHSVATKPSPGLVKTFPGRQKFDMVNAGGDFRDLPECKLRRRKSSSQEGKQHTMVRLLFFSLLMCILINVLIQHTSFHASSGAVLDILSSCNCQLASTESAL